MSAQVQIVSTETLANQAGGANVNELTSSDPADVESLSGMAWLTGVPIEVERT